jgi:tRNA A37 threonylcarbamoyladenosine biosynthesis protein TsaE
VIEQLSESEAETVEIGRAFARALKAGDVVLLAGPLGGR